MLIRSVSLVAVGSLLGVFVPRLAQDRAPAAQNQDHGSPPKTGVHRMMASLAGEYDVALTFTPPQGDAIQSKGTAKLTSILDGRFLLEENEGELMGTKIKGMRIYGWNAAAKQIEGVWMYTESNAIMRLSGQPGADRQSAKFQGVVQETAEKKATVDIAAKRNQDGSLEFTIAHANDAGEAATLHETYTKKK
ncbi:MAG: DUF1579 family protein [Planctomycetota bacterium]